MRGRELARSCPFKDEMNDLWKSVGWENMYDLAVVIDSCDQGELFFETRPPDSTR